MAACCSVGALAAACLLLFDLLELASFVLLGANEDVELLVLALDELDEGAFGVCGLLVLATEWIG